MEDKKVMKVAVQIDAENISWKYAKRIFDEASNLGVIVCKRIYGDWSSPSVASWKAPIMEYSIQAIQQFQNTSGKNSSDSALIIDAMDLLHEGRYQCICLVSSDSDFTRLASRLRESEIYVVGMGEQKTPTSFRSACDKFLYLDVLMRDGMPESGVSKPIVQNTGSGSVDGKSTLRQDDIPAEAGSGLNLQLIIDAIDDIVSQDSDDEGWYFMGELGNRLASRFPDFDVRNFGFYKLTPFIESLKCYDVKSEKNPSNPSLKLVYIRKKK